MPIFTNVIPLSVYIHLPWCVQKCPYCDFNSHAIKDSLPEALYVNAVLSQLDDNLSLIQGRPLTSLFFGGGTPSLFSADMIARLIDGISQRITLPQGIEITLEANPGTAEQARFKAFRQAGISRLSLGIQSLQNTKLKQLGRIHDSIEAMRAIEMAKSAGFSNFNLDLMFGLPAQSIQDALHDLQTALSFKPTHLSWYQLTIEPNTIFYKQRPTLPADDLIWEMQQAGQALLNTHGFKQYEVSAYSRPQHPCQHNLNYWQFGDYLGLGAGAHSKITDYDKQLVQRFAQVRQPTDYLIATKRVPKHQQWLSSNDLIFEFMLNALRLTDGVPSDVFVERTGLPLSRINPLIDTARKRGLLEQNINCLRPTAKGQHFLNDLVEIFLP